MSSVIFILIMSLIGFISLRLRTYLRRRKLPIVRRIRPSLISYNIVGIQQMSEPCGLIFNINFAWDRELNKWRISK